MFKLFGDQIIWGISVLLFLISLLLVYSSGGPATLGSHISHLIMGLGLIFIFSRFNYKYFTNLSMILLFLSGFLLLFLIISPSHEGSVVSTLKGRWIRFGFFSFQPSELAKYSLVLFVSRNLSLYKDFLNSFNKLFLYIYLPSILISLLILPFNLSTVILIFFIIVFLIFISGYPLLLYLRYVLLPTLIIGVVFCTLLIIPANPILDQLPRLTTWKNRICSEEISMPPFSWVDCSAYDARNIYSNNYQISKALGAINRGGIIGKGAGNSYYKKLLPDSKSDFIFTILIEEYGVIGALVVMFIYLVFYQRILILGIKSKNHFPRLLLFGLGSVILFQALLHMSVSVNLIPVTGQTLPLISKGGSSVWVTSLAFGIILNISHQIQNQLYD